MVAQIPDESDTVGVIRLPPAVFVEAQRVGGARTGRTVARGVGDGEGLLLEGQRHVEAAPSGLLERRDGVREGAGLHVDRFVTERLTGLRGKLGMDKRRLAVGDWVTHDRVTVHGRGSRGSDGG